MAIDPKKTKKTPPKKPNNPKLPKLPPGAKVKVIEITPRTFFLPLIFIGFLSALLWVWSGYKSEKVHYNDNI